MGYRLTEQALVFGGDVLTVTDIAVAAGLIDLGDRARVASLPAALVKEALARVRAMLEEGVDRMKTEAGDVPLIAVGGGLASWCRRAWPASRRSSTFRTRPWPTRWGPPSPRSSGEVDQIFQDLSAGRGDRAGPASSPRTRRWRPAPTARP